MLRIQQKLHCCKITVTYSVKLSLNKAKKTSDFWEIFTDTVKKINCIKPTIYYLSEMQFLKNKQPTKQRLVAIYLCINTFSSTNQILRNVSFYFMELLDVVTYDIQSLPFKLILNITCVHYIGMKWKCQICGTGVGKTTTPMIPSLLYTLCFCLLDRANPSRRNYGNYRIVQFLWAQNQIKIYHVMSKVPGKGEICCKMCCLRDYATDTSLQYAICMDDSYIVLKSASFWHIYAN